MIFPFFEIVAMIFPFLIIASLSLMVMDIFGSPLMDVSNAQSSVGMLLVFVARTRKAFAPHGSIQSCSASYRYTSFLSCSRNILFAASNGLKCNLETKDSLRTYSHLVVTPQPSSA